MTPALRTSHFALAGLAMMLAATAACRDTFYPLKNRVTPGIDPFVVFVADAQAGAGELWAGQAGGGTVYQVTYTLSDEDAPALTPSGGVLAFTRAPTAADSAGRRIWFMNLVSGNEREVPALPDGAVPLSLAFSDDGAILFVRTTKGIYALQSPPSVPTPRRLSAIDSLRADSVLTVFIGDPRYALIAQCRKAIGSLCAFPPGQDEAPLQAGGVDPVRWGADSVAYFVGDRLIVRSGGGGRAREVRWVRMPPAPRRPTFAPAAQPPLAPR
ncbi:MAG: hypothetical protein ABJB33_07195 [Gemmatimonadota bacterium]